MSTLPSPKDLSPQEKRALLEKLLRERAAKSSDAQLEKNSSTSQRAHSTGSIPVQRRDREYFPLSAAQQRLLFLDQFEPNTATYNTSLAFRLIGPLHVDALQQSLNEIVQRHEVLRTVFHVQNEEGVQAVLQGTAFSLPVVDLESIAEGEREAEMFRLANQEASSPFDLAKDLKLRVKLFRLRREEHIIVITMHHIASDGWSFGVFMRELTLLYEGYVTGKPVQLPALPVQYIDYASWHQEWLQSEAVKTQLAYWKKQLEGAPAVIELPIDRPRPALQTFRGEWHHTRYGPELTASLKSFARGEGATLFMVLLAAFETLLYRYTSQDDILIGSPIAGRTNPETKELIGLFINTIVLRADLSNNPTFRELVARVRQAAYRSYENQDVPFEKLVEELQPQRDLSHSPLFQVMFVLQNQPLPGLRLHQLTSTPIIEINPRASKFDLTLSLTEQEGGLTTVFEYNPDLFDAATIARMVAHYEELLNGLLKDPDQHIADLPLLTQAEKYQLLVEWNNTQLDYPADTSVSELFESQALQAPDAIAVTFEGKSLTYQQLNQRANQLAHHLQGLGVKPDTLVGIYMERSLEMVVGLLGILKAGGAYVPLDPAFPSDRLEFMLADSQAAILLTQEKLADQLATPPEMKLVCLDKDWAVIAREVKENLVPQAKPEHLAYVIYTSGSTGKPKGVQIQQQSLVNFLTSMRQTPGLTDQDVLLSVTTLSFDIAGLEIFLPLTTGARLELASRETATDGMQLMAILETCGATVMQATPITWRMLIDAGWQGNPQLKILCGGEALPMELAKQILARCGSLWNMYGPTETTIWSTLRQVLPEDTEISIGKPIGNTKCYILDSHLQPVPIGVAGDLYIGGDGLARGYLNRPELTEEKFIPNPFSVQPGARLYKTGDLAKYRANGEIYYLGRGDNQIKIRGFRVELGEIEAVLAQHPAIREIVVIVREDHPGDKRLVGYPVLQEGAEKSTSTDLRAFAREQLPEYMIPSAFVFMQEYPLTPNKKIDRKALPAPDQSRPELAHQYVAPRDEVEAGVTNIFAGVLKLERVGVQDNFFDLGGHSLLATQVISRVRGDLHVDLPLRALFEALTPEELSKRIKAIRQLREDQLQAVPLAASDDDREEFRP